jgi:hypothetical protein
MYREPGSDAANRSRYKFALPVGNPNSLDLTGVVSRGVELDSPCQFECFLRNAVEQKMYREPGSDATNRSRYKFGLPVGNPNSIDLTGVVGLNWTALVSSSVFHSER